MHISAEQFLVPIDLAAFGISTATRLYVARLDLLDDIAPGNKRFKLAPHLQCARESGKSGLLSFGGCWSNHLHALANVGAAAGFRTHAMVRGERVAALSQTLLDMERSGMALEFVDRTTYRRRNDQDYLDEVRKRYPDYWVIPEGGASLVGARGCAAIAGLIQRYCPDVQIVAAACGTGTTVAGLVSAGMCEVRGYSVLRDGGSIAKRVREFLQEMCLVEEANWSIQSNAHGGGYARLPDAYREFLLRFEHITGIPLDPVYTVKMLVGLLEDIEYSRCGDAKCIVALHGGGMQGRRGFTSLPPASYLE